MENADASESVSDIQRVSLFKVYGQLRSLSAHCHNSIELNLRHCITATTAFHGMIEKGTERRINEDSECTTVNKRKER